MISINTRLRHLREQTPAALIMIALAAALTGCNDVPSDRIDTQIPPGMPTPAGVKTAPATPAKPLPPPPTEADLGIPIYPHATTYADTAGMPVAPLTDSGMAQAILVTTDSVDQVVAFYKERIIETNARGQRQASTPLEEKTATGQRQVTFIGNDAQRNVQMVEIRDEAGKTKIELIRAAAKILPAVVPGASENSPPTGTDPSPVAPSMPGSPPGPAASNPQPPPGSGSTPGGGAPRSVIPR